MDIIQLPTLPPTAPLRDALRIMRASHRSALITQGATAVLMVSSRDVRRGINRKQELIGDLEGIEAIPVSATPSGLGPRELAASSPLGRQHQRLDMSLFAPYDLTGAFTSTGGDYAVIAQVPGVAYILTRHETRAELYADPPQRCACENPNYVHEYGEADGVSTGDMCRVCGFPITCG